MKRKTIFIAVAVLAAVGGGAYSYFHYTEATARVEAARAGLPRRPAPGDLPAELWRRVEAAERDVRRGENAVENLGLVATLYHANGYEEEATEAYQALLRADPKNPRWAGNLAHLFVDHGRLAEATVLWRHLTALEPGYVAAHIRLGDVLTKLDRWDEAERAYLDGLKVAPRDAYLLAGLARVDVQRGRFDAARDKLEAATEASTFRIGNALLVTVYEKLGLQAKAEAVRGQAKSFGTYFDPPDPYLDSIYDECYDAYRLTLGAGMADRRGDRSTAVRLLERTVRLHPAYFLGHYQLGSLMEKSGVPEKAEFHFRKAAELNPAFGDAWLSLYRIANATRGRGAALAVLREGLQRCPDSPGLHLEYGRWLREQKRFDEALREFAIVADLRPAEVDGLIEAAQIHFTREEVEAGVAILKRVLEIMPAHPVGLTTLAFVSVSTGDKAGARAWLKQCREQPRVPREDLQRLASAYQERFGESPW
ncbi:tetratricopeptide repeat protein [Nibricoccus sp. IMCC34717]|uniref:tetratricopeptide repeat protein n=1 Tax=Nibricoccus sp. IMCC34717 TaxID=3034021 RepID=UPI00384A9AC4